MPYASPALLRALGYAAAELLHHPALDFVHPGDRSAAYAAGRGAPAGASTTLMVRLRHKDGSWRLFDGTSTNLLHDAAVRSVVFNGNDVTERPPAPYRTPFH